MQLQLTVGYLVWTVMSSYSSTLDGSILILTCKDDTSRSTVEQVFHVTCHSNGSWIPNPADFTCSSLNIITTALPGTEY